MSWDPPPLVPGRAIRELAPESAWRRAMQAILPGADLQPFPTGSDVVWGDGQQVVKLSTPRWATGQQRERQVLQAIEGRLALATPRVKQAGEIGGWPFFVMEHVPGRSLEQAWPELDAAGRTRIAQELGTFVASLQALPCPGLTDDWPQLWQECRTDPLTRARRGQTLAGLTEYEPFLEAHGALHSAATVLVHSELLPAHLLVDEYNRLCACIDWGDARLAAPEYELAAPLEFLFRGEPGLAAAFLAACYGPEHGITPESLLAWALQHQFNHLPRMLGFLGLDHLPPPAELARRFAGLHP
ncbi:MAG: aminoglycoside 3'-phosphotransferase/choline kinase family protein [Planctomycetota bacterium]